LTEIKATRGDDPVERAPVDDQVLDGRKCGGAERLDVDRVAVAETAHVELARRGARVGSVREAVDHEAAHAADPLAAI
jgi:hypothetical protein